MYFNIERVEIGLNKKIALISDIHYYHKYNNKILEKVLTKIKKEKPNYIVIAGDILDDAREAKNKHIDYLTEFIKSLTYIAPTFITLGNHDISGRKVEGQIMPTKWLNKLKKINNLYILDGNGLIMDNITFYGYNAKYDYYKSKEEDLKILTDDFNVKSDSNYDILVTHSPINLTDRDTFDELGLNRYNLVLSGHMHSGLIPEWLPGNNGLIGPSKQFFPLVARGHVNVDNTTFIISGGVIKLSHAAGFLRHFNGFFPISITIID